MMKRIGLLGHGACAAAGDAIVQTRQAVQMQYANFIFILRKKRVNAIIGRAAPAALLDTCSARIGLQADAAIPARTMVREFPVSPHGAPYVLWVCSPISIDLYSGVLRDFRPFLDLVAN
jgi:hypothetical protein